MFKVLLQCGHKAAPGSSRTIVWCPFCQEPQLITEPTPVELGTQAAIAALAR